MLYYVWQILTFTQVVLFRFCCGILRTEKKIMNSDSIGISKQANQIKQIGKQNNKANKEYANKIKFKFDAICNIPFNYTFISVHYTLLLF